MKTKYIDELNVAIFYIENMAFVKNAIPQVKKATFGTVLSRHNDITR